MQEKLPRRQNWYFSLIQLLHFWFKSHRSILSLLIIRASLFYLGCD
jgi:hypothetical protein